MGSSRRVFLGGSGVLGLAVAREAHGQTPVPDATWLQLVLERYASFGLKASGGVGGDASGAWLESEQTGYGYSCRRQMFDVPFFEIRRTVLSSGTAQATHGTWDEIDA